MVAGYGDRPFSQMGQLRSELQGAVEQLDPVAAELLAGQVVELEDGAQARALAQGLVGALVGAGVESVGDVQQQGAGVDLGFAQAFRVAAAVRMLLMLQDDSRARWPSIRANSLPPMWPSSQRANKAASSAGCWSGWPTTWRPARTCATS